MRVVQTVFGVFHHFDLARELERMGDLTALFSTWPWQRLQREGVPKEKIHTFPWIHTPEYLLRRAGLLPSSIESWTGYANALAFDEYTAHWLPECDALIALSGSSLKTGTLVQRRGGVFICDRGSSHQRYQNWIVSEEYRRWGVNASVSDERDTRREEDIYARADAITVPSSFAAYSFAEMGVDASKVHVIPYGVRLERFQPSATPPGDPRQSFEVLFAGSVSLRKGIPYLLQAFAQLQHPHKRLRFVGAVSREVVPMLERLPKDGVEFLGPQSQETLAKHMGQSHVLVLPSIEEGLALVLGQALACGCPVLATAHTGAEDLFTDEIEGFIVPIRDPDALRDRLQRLIDEPGLLPRMRSAALQRVSSIGGWALYGKRWHTLLRQLQQS